MTTKKERKSLNKVIPPTKQHGDRITWFEALQFVKSYVFKISTPTGSGTGFQISYANNSKLCGIATAYHVVAHEYKWGYPIEITHFDSKESLMLKESERAIFIHPKEDLAFILFSAKKLPIKTDPPQLIDPKKTLKAGVEVGWCGFPSVASNELCFFNGYISCYLNNMDSYLVDGVAINGVSGGPAFWTTYKTHQVRICGVVSAYIPNTATGTILPGLSMLTSVEAYQKDLEDLKTFDAAYNAAKKEETEKKKKGEEIPTPSVSPSTSLSPSPSPSPTE